MNSTPSQPKSPPEPRSTPVERPGLKKRGEGKDHLRKREEYFNKRRGGT